MTKLEVKLGLSIDETDMILNALRSVSGSATEADTLRRYMRLELEIEQAAERIKRRQQVATAPPGGEK